MAMNWQPCSLESDQCWAGYQKWHQTPLQFSVWFFNLIYAVLKQSNDQFWYIVMKDNIENLALPSNEVGISQLLHSNGGTPCTFNCKSFPAKGKHVRFTRIDAGLNSDFVATYSQDRDKLASCNQSNLYDLQKVQSSWQDFPLFHFFQMWAKHNTQCRLSA